MCEKQCSHGGVIKEGNQLRITQGAKLMAIGWLATPPAVTLSWACRHEEAATRWAGLDTELLPSSGSLYAVHLCVVHRHECNTMHGPPAAIPTSSEPSSPAGILPLSAVVSASQCKVMNKQLRLLGSRCERRSTLNSMAGSPLST